MALPRPNRIAIVSTTSACGKTTLGKALAAKLDARFIELDALVHGPGWVETPDDVLRATLSPLLEAERWVVDGNYEAKVGELVLARADLVVWLDLPASVWMPRLAARTMRRWLLRETLWNGNRESLRTVFWGRDSLVGFALRSYRQRRRAWPSRFAGYRYLRLRSPAEVERFLEGF